MSNQFHLAISIIISFGTSQAFSEDQRVLREDFADVAAHFPVKKSDILHPQLELRLSGDAEKMLKLSFHPEIKGDPHYIWSGQCQKRWACWFDLKQQASFVRAGLLLKTRTKQADRNLHFLIKTPNGSFSSTTPVAIPLEKPNWNEQKVPVAELAWHKLDLQTLRPGESASVDLASIQAIGFTDFQAGDLSNACSRLDWFELVEPNPNFFEAGQNYYRTALDIGLFAGDNKVDEIPRAIIIRLSDQIWAAFDPDLLRLAAIWKTPEGATSPITLETMAQISFPQVTARAKKSPRPIGASLFYFPRTSQLSFRHAPIFTDARTITDTRDIKVGPLPLTIGRWEGIEDLHDGRIVLCYRIGTTFVRETMALAQSRTGVHLKRVFLYQNEGRLPRTAIIGNNGSELKLRHTLSNKLSTHTDTTETTAALLEIPLDGLTGFSRNKMHPVPIIQAKTCKSLGLVQQDYFLKEVFTPYPLQCNRPIRSANIRFTTKGIAYLTTYDGDVWRIGDINTDTPHWLRVAQGLYEPMGLEISDEGIFVFGRDQISELIDKDGDHIIDYYRCVSDQAIQSIHTRDYATSIVATPDGGFIVAKGGIIQGQMSTHHRGAIIQVSADGTKAETLADGLRLPYVGQGTNSEYLISDQQGHYIPSTPLHRLTKGAYYGFEPTNHHKRITINEPLLWFSYRDNQSGASFIKPLDKGKGKRNAIDSIFGNLPIHLSWFGHLYYIQTGTTTKNANAAFAAKMPFHTDFPLLGGDYHPENFHLFATGFGIPGFGTPTKNSTGILELSLIDEPLAVRTAHWDKNILTLKFNRYFKNFSQDAPLFQFEIEGWNYLRTNNYGSGNYLPDGSPGKLVLYPEVKLKDPEVLLAFPYLPKLQQLTIAWEYLPGSMKERSGLLQLRSPGSAKHIDEQENRIHNNSTAKNRNEIDGEKIFKTHNCAICHSMDETRLVGPSLKGLIKRTRTVLRNGKEVENIKTTTDYLRKSILHPNDEIVKGYLAAMPSFSGVLKEKELQALIEYLKGL